ncbi:MAG: hypothetical protein C0467_14410 [Planctomycetaceae bacterium]|nr:hypothetical protein [Planctomycetaceae bacterium]
MPVEPWNVEQIEAKAPDAKSVAEARKLLGKGDFGKVEARADGKGWCTTCKGMTGTYEVSVRRGPRGGLHSSCTCPSYKKPCKHALALLLYLAEHPEARPEDNAPSAPPRDLESLLRAVFTTPEDDTPRLVFADYLEENDQPARAALIRVQCELAHLAKDDPNREATAAREAEALAAVWEQIGKLPANFEGGFKRGFLRLTVKSAVSREAEGLPARFVRLFHEGWVEALKQPPLLPKLLPLYRLVGEIDLSKNAVAPFVVPVIAEMLQPNDPATRIRTVKLAATNQRQWESLISGSKK